MQSVARQCRPELHEERLGRTSGRARRSGIVGKTDATIWTTYVNIRSGFEPQQSTKAAEVVKIVRQHNLQLQAYRQPRDRRFEEDLSRETIESPEPLRVVMAGTAGTGNTVVINEIIPAVGPETFKLLVPSGNTDREIGKQVRENPNVPINFSENSTNRYR